HGDALDRLRVRLLEDERTDRVVDEQELVYAAATAEPGVAALRAARRLVEGRPPGRIERLEQVALPNVAREVAGVRVLAARSAHAHALARQPQLLQLERLGGVRGLAVRAEDAHQALRQDADDARAKKERLGAHVDRTRDRARRVVRVDR